jgi:acyl carrier protein
MDKDAVSDLITSYLSELLNLPENKIDPNQPFERYGLDSTAAAGLTGVVGEKLDLELGDNVAFDYPTVASMTDHILSLAGRDA